MRLNIGQSYELVSRVLRDQPPRFTVRDLTEYRSGYIVSGEVHSFQTHLYLPGVRTIPAKSGVFVVFSHMSEPVVVEMVKLLKGPSLRIRSLLGLESQPIVTWGERLGKVWYTEPGAKTSLDEKKRRGRTVIDLFMEVLDKEQVPAWFMQDRQYQPPPSVSTFTRPVQLFKGI